jgi:glycosyltransferase involved in cell wall biosynthesis
VKWLLGDIYQKLISKRSDFKIYIAGKHTPESYFQFNNSNIEIVGEIENAADFMNSKSIMIVPLKSGSGMRLKIIEGMSIGKAIISTSIGAEGINYTHNENIIIANTSDEIVNAIEYLLDNKEKIKSIGDAAKQLIYSQYDNNVVVNKLVEFYSKEVLK